MPLVACAKGCGHDVDVSQDEFAAAMAKGVLRFEHKLCPGQEVPIQYTVKIEVFRNDEKVQDIKLAGTSATIVGASFREVLPDIIAKVDANWQKIAEFASVAEAELDDAGQEVADDTDKPTTEPS